MNIEIIFCLYKFSERLNSCIFIYFKISEDQQDMLIFCKCCFCKWSSRFELDFAASSGIGKHQSLPSGNAVVVTFIGSPCKVHWNQDIFKEAYKSQQRCLLQWKANCKTKQLLCCSLLLGDRWRTLMKSFKILLSLLLSLIAPVSGMKPLWFTRAD